MTPATELRQRTSPAADTEEVRRPMFLDSRNTAEQIRAQRFAIDCPHCELLSNVSPVSIPRYEMLMRFKPKYVGLVYRCDSCNYPIFLRFSVNGYGSNRIDLAKSFEQIERPSERFDFTHLPDDVARDFREALKSYSSACYNAFASMCRRTAQDMFADLGEGGKLRIFDQLNDIKDIADINDDTFRVLERVIFDTDTDRRPNIPDLDSPRAGVLLEVMKDVLYEAYVRRGKIQQAMSLRRQGFQDQLALGVGS